MPYPDNIIDIEVGPDGKPFIQTSVTPGGKFSKAPLFTLLGGEFNQGRLIPRRRHVGCIENLREMLRSMIEVDIFETREYHDWWSVLSCRCVPCAAYVLLVILMVMTVQ